MCEVCGDPTHTSEPEDEEAAALRLLEHLVPLRDWEESQAVLSGRLQAVRQERDDLREQVRRLRDERAVWVELLQRVMAERDALRGAAGAA